MKKVLAGFLASLASAAVMKDAPTEFARTEKKMRAFKEKLTPDREMTEQTTGRQHCSEVKFCSEMLLGKPAEPTCSANKEELQQLPPIPTPNPYSLSDFTVTASDTITATLTNVQETNYQALSLTMELTFYQLGIMRTTINCPGEDPRFSISSTGIGVEWDQLVQVTGLTDMVVTTADNSTVTLVDENNNTIEYFFEFNPFRVTQSINGQLGVYINQGDDLRYAPPTAPQETYMDGYDQLISGFEIGLSFTFDADYIFGLPMRAVDSFALPLNETYRLFNQDLVTHPYGNVEPLYGNWPYLTAHSAAVDASVIWMNSAETYVSVDQVINNATNTTGILGEFISVGGQLEFFVFGTTTGPKDNQKIVSEITGYAPLP